MKGWTLLLTVEDQIFHKQAFAEFERAMIRERTTAGLVVARAEGRVGGRPKKLSQAQRADIADNVLSGRRTGAQMARLYRVSQPTTSRIISEYRLEAESSAK